jgi:hypothetical protein
MVDNPLASLAGYSRFMAELLDRPDVIRSTINVWSASPYTGVAEGEVLFKGEVRLRIREEIDFDEKLITSYGYEVYKKGEKEYWYDDFPHPNDPELAYTYPHHKHVSPNIKENRIPAPNLNFSTPNIPFIIQELESLILESD